MKGLLTGVDAPDPGVLPEPDGLTSLDAGSESPRGPNEEADGFLGPTTLGSSTAEDGRGDWLGESFGALGATSDWGLRSPPCTASIDVGGVSCWGGEICGVIMAGSFLGSTGAAGFPS